MSESETIYVPSSCLGMIIGKGGSMIKDLSQQTGCRINIQKDKIDGDKTGVSLEVGASSRDQAKSRITEITERRRENNGGDRGYGNNDHSYGNNDRGFGNKIGEASSRGWFSSRLLSVSASAVHDLDDGMSPSWWVRFDVVWTEGIIAASDKNGTFYVWNLSDGFLNKSFVNTIFMSSQNSYLLNIWCNISLK